MSAGVVLEALVPPAVALVRELIEAANEAGDAAALDRLGDELDVLRARLRAVRSVVDVVHDAAERRRRELRARETDPAALPPVLSPTDHDPGK